jgi:hypothetical protein
MSVPAEGLWPASVDATVPSQLVLGDERRFLPIVATDRFHNDVIRC